jgi:flagellar biosynthesis/type III secretory pathway protein FliH
MRKTFKPVEEINGASVLPPADLTFYQSRAVPGAVSVMLTQEGVVQAGMRLDKEQAIEAARTLLNLVGEDDDPYDHGYSVGYREGLEEGQRIGYDDGYAEGDSEGWENGYQLGFERGIEGAEETA